ncbi:MAG: hypothetical protein R2698_11185 [Microthrixaceae bacterium]
MATTAYPRAISLDILGRLLESDEEVMAAHDRVMAWLDEHRAEIGDHAVAWAASKACDLGIERAERGAASAIDTQELARFSELPTAARVTVALVRFCNLGVDDVATLTAREPWEIDALLRFDDGTDLHPRTEDTGPRPQPTDPALRRRRLGIALAVTTVLGTLVIAGMVARSGKGASRQHPVAKARLASAALVNRSDRSKACTDGTPQAALPPRVDRLDVSGEERTVRWVAGSPSAPDAPRLLVVDLPDLGQSIDEHVAETSFDTFARAANAVVATVGPADRAAWNVTASPDGPADDAYLEQVLRRGGEEFCVSPRRVVLAGRGAGAHLAAAFACRHPATVRALILVAGVYHPEECASDAVDSVLSFRGSADEVFPPSGGTGAAYDLALSRVEVRDGTDYRLGATNADLNRWASLLGCRGAATQQIGFVDVRIVTRCGRSGTGELWRVTRPEGHVWFGSVYDVAFQFVTTGPLAAVR